MTEFLRDYQAEAVSNMHNGCILCGGVGTGKSRTSLSYFFVQNGGEIDPVKGITREMSNPKDLYIITTAKKRDGLDWVKEMIIFGMSPEPKVSAYKNRIVVDSWNNIAKYVGVTNAFFIFDEQRVVGKGTWVKSFLKIARVNNWVLLSATPGDTWSDYIPVFIANGFYKNRTEFNQKHVEFARYVKYPKIERYWGTGVLNYYRKKVLVTMECERRTLRHKSVIPCEYDRILYRNALRTRYNTFKQQPMQGAGELCYCLRQIVNTAPERLTNAIEIVRTRKKAIIFYNFDYELNALKLADWSPNTVVKEWNGHRHDELPSGENWVYLVQYTAGSEGWNCITTDTIIFYSLNYSYKVMEQASGRIDRMNTPYKDLYYYYLESTASIDLAIKKALSEKRNFNERAFVAR